MGDLGDDILDGGAGTDRLTGGDGADTFRFAAASDIAAGDTIGDFHSDQADRIDLSAIDAVSGTPANEAFSFIGGAMFSGAAGQLRFTTDGTDGTLEGDLDGVGGADFRIVLTGVITLQPGDFIL